MILGFTGTRRGMTRDQRESARVWLVSMAPEVVVHGDCVGADAEFDAIARELGIKRIILPSDLYEYRARCGGPGAIVFRPRAPLARNRTIVDLSDIVVAAPPGPEERRSGTWSTVRHALHERRPVTIVYPAGDMEQRT